MYPTRTTSTTGSFHVPPVPEPQAPPAATTSGWAAQTGWEVARTPEPEHEPVAVPVPADPAATPAETTEPWQQDRAGDGPARAAAPAWVQAATPELRTRTETGPQLPHLPHPQPEAGPHLPHPQPEAVPEFAHAQAEAGPHFPHPQPEAVPEFAHAQAEAGPHFPHPQPEVDPHFPHPQPEAVPEFAHAQAESGPQAGHAGATALRLGGLEAEAGRSHPQDDVWPVPSPVRGEPLAEAGSPAEGEAARRGGLLIGAPAPEADPAGREPSWSVPAPAAAEAVASGAAPAPAESLTSVGEAAPQGGLFIGAPAPEAEPVARDLSWSVPAPAGEAAAHAEPRTDTYGEIGIDFASDAHGEAGRPAEPEVAQAGPSSEVSEAEVPGPSWSVPGPGPGVVEVVARAVARMGEDDTQDLPRIGAVRGIAVSEVPVHLPFRGAARPPALGDARSRAHAHAPAEAKPKPPARPTPGRRVPRGDDRLREHHGPVLPGWIGVAVGGLALAGCAVVLWRAGAVPDALAVAFGAEPRPYRGLQARFWPPLAFLGIVALLALGGLGRGRAGHAWVLTLFGRYRGTVRRSGLTWISPLLLRRRVDVRLRHWRSDPMSAVDSGGLALQVVVQVVWQVKDTARATLAVADHVDYLAEQVESAMARVLSQLPADAFHEDAPTLRDAEAVGDALTRMLAAETEAVGVEVFSAQPTRIEYAPEVAEAMRRRRVAAIDAKHRDTVLTSVVDAVDDTVHRLTSRGIVELDDYERKALVKDLTVAFYTGRPE
ncbi:SPFH domain-containing protein [Streptomyces sp. NBC_00454]|uniref:SPFH domain-containing protein n=1 Tax=Streptomyces sp. NBC_00454 TaxID=2975747 RepID=UPI0030E09FDC